MIHIVTLVTLNDIPITHQISD